MNQWKKFLSAGLAIASIMLGFAVVVPRLGQAHAGYDRSVPEANSVVADAPAIVEIYFTQELDSNGTLIRVMGPDGAQVDRGDTALDLFDPNRKRVTVTLKPELGPGTYTVEWTTLSAEDGESDSGTFSFKVDGASGTPSASPVASPLASPIASPEGTASTS